MLMKMRSRMQNQKGFTLVELMVVVVILGILVAIAVPVYSNITEQAAIKAHNANVRTLIGAATTYVASEGLPTNDETWDGTDDNSKEYLQEWPKVPTGMPTAFGSHTAYKVTITNAGKITCAPSFYNKS